MLTKHGFLSKVFVAEEPAYRDVLEFSPDIVSYSCITGEQKWVLSSIRKLKDLGSRAFFVVGGPHPTYFPSMVENPLINAVCIGEGEYAALDLAIAFEAGEDPYRIKNLYFNVGGEIVRNEVRPLIEDLDSLPFPDRSYYDRYRFLASNPYKTFITSRGCPFQCTFCFNHVLQRMYGNASRYVRRRSPAQVIEELKEVNAKWGIREVRFSDDHFVLNVEWLRELVSLYKKEVGVPYSINARVDVLDEEKIALLKETGCRLVCFGIESGRELLRNMVLKKRISDEQIFQAARLLKKYKIKFLSSNIIGLPNEKAEDAWQTIEMNQKIGTDLPWFSMMQYYPGTEIYDTAIREGLLDADYDVDKMGSYFRNEYLKQGNMNELRNIHSFSILVSRFRFLEPLAKILARKVRPNRLFQIIFKLSYLHLTFRRSNMGVLRVLHGWTFYRSRIFG